MPYQKNENILTLQEKKTGAHLLDRLGLTLTLTLTLTLARWETRHYPSPPLLGLTLLLYWDKQRIRLEMGNSALPFSHC